MDFRDMINTEIKRRGVNINRLSKTTGQSRDSLYRFLNGKTDAINSSTLEVVLDYLDFETVKKAN